MNVSIKGLDKAEVLAELVGAARGMPCTLAEAEEFIASGNGPASDARMSGELKIDSVAGVPICCDLSGDDFDPSEYDRHHGEGAAARVVADLREAALSGERS